MNLKEALKNMTDEELGELLTELVNCQREKAKEIEDEPEHYYVFTGTWSWDIWAKSKEEAERCFKNAYTEEFEILTDEYKVEECE